MNMDFQIRNEEIKDIDQVREILKATFPSDAESKLVDALQANGKAILSLVAVKDERVIGHILVSPVTTTPPSKSRGIGLAPVAVHPDVQAWGVGSRLIREGTSSLPGTWLSLLRGTWISKLLSAFWV